MLQPASNRTFSRVLVNESCEPFAEEALTIKAVKVLVYCVVLVVSLVGNSVIIANVARSKTMQTTVNYLIANMAASDLLISTFAVPMKLVEILVGPRRWLLHGTVGLVSCKLAYFLQDISSTVSVQSIVVIAIDRYRGIGFPFRQAIVTPKRCKFIIPLVWLSSMGLHATYFYTVRLISQNNTTYCVFSWEPAFHPQKAQELYMIVIFILVILLPFSVITVLYSRIIWSLRKEGPSSFSCRRHKENVKVFKYICAIMIAFAFCILPINIYAILYIFVWKWKMPCRMEQLGFAVHLALFSNAAITPVINLVFNDKHRKGLKDILITLKCCRADTRMNSVQGDVELQNYCLRDAPTGQSRRTKT